MAHILLLLGSALLAGAVRPKANHWAVLVSGSNGYGNYRHHADTCHAYHLLREGGIPEDHIITFLYDDVAADPSNPYPGTLYNRPTQDGTPGKDVYAGCKKSYTGEDVTPANFLAVLTGNASAVKGGSGEVLQSNSNSYVFWGFFDHGASGLVAFPAGGYLYKDDLWAALDVSIKNGMWKQFTAYIEACESGSMFDGYPTDKEVYITTAANPDESSWGWYCPPDDSVNGTHLNTCLGDLYSINWLEDSEKPGNMRRESLDSQYKGVRDATNMSHVMQYGQQSWTDEPIGNFLGNLSITQETGEAEDSTTVYFPSQTYAFDRRMSSSAPAPFSAWDSRYATLASLQLRVASTRADSVLGSALRAELRYEQEQAVLWDTVFTLISKSFLGASSAEALLARAVPMTTWAESQWECYKTGNAVVQAACGAPYGDYGLRYARVVAHMCSNAGQGDGVVRALEEACGAVVAA